MMGSGAETAEETINFLASQGEKVGMVKVRLYRPFSGEHLLAALPSSVRRLAVLDRCKEPGSAGEPLYVDVTTALAEGLAEGRAPFERMPRVVGGRYGLASKEFTPAMVMGIFEELKKQSPKNHFTVGINDDVSFTSIDYDPDMSIEPDDVVRAMFWGLGADGTVGANKNSIKIIGEETDNYAQGYFHYDSKKSGTVTVSHLRFGPRPIRAPYLIRSANFVAVHQFDFLERYDVLRAAAPGGVFLLNSPYTADQVWDQLPRTIQQTILDRKLKFYVIDAYDVARETGMGVRINTVMQTCFFAISGVLPRDEAIAQIKKAIKKTYGKRGDTVVKKNYEAVDATLANLYEVSVPEKITSSIEVPFPVPSNAPDFVRSFTGEIIAGRGDLLPVSAIPVDGTYPVGTTQYEKRNIALDVPVWDPDLCIQCGKCVLVCPHAVIRSKVYDPALLANAPETFKSADARWKELPGQAYSLQVAVEDCTGCTLCVEVCPVKDKSNVSRKAINMAPQRPLRETERVNWDYFLSLPETPKTDGLTFSGVKNIQLLHPYFEFSGACSGCGETPYIKLATQLFGDRMVVANATGCSSIYGGNLPTTPWAAGADGRGPAWSNSLFEDNAEFGLGMRLTFDKRQTYARELVERLRGGIGSDLADTLLNAEQTTEHTIDEQRGRVDALRRILASIDDPAARELANIADSLVKKSVWIIGGDGWAYDIGYGGLDHVLASGRNVNVLVLDTEVYSNTGGQASKATPMGAVAKFAAGGKPTFKKDLAMMAVSYGNVYVARVALGANDGQTVRAFLEAEAYDGPSLIIAYSPCINQGIDMARSLDQQRLAVESGHWPLYRYNPALELNHKNPFQLDSKAPKLPLRDYVYNETRYRMLEQSNPESAATLLAMAQEHVNEQWHKLELMAKTEVEPVS
jgi:pyruvate-ferredoxin/flavodoxin oxidoreductase